MNSIYGVIGKIEEKILKDMGCTLKHRGEKLTIKHVGEGVTFCYSSNNEKERIYSEDEFTILSDARIYNIDQLNKYLKERNVNRGIKTKEEILIKLYKLEGINGLDKVNGDYSISIWNNKSKELILGRDYCGCRPLYYTILPDNAGIAFASEYKALLCIPMVLPETNIDMIQCLQYHKKLPIGNTLVKNISSPPPGSLEYFDKVGNKLNTQKMPSLQVNIRYNKENEAVTLLRDELRKAIALRIDDPGKIGIALSGGIDSIGIAHICRSLHPNAEIHTFTAGSKLENREMETAEKVSLSINSIHHPVIVSPVQIKDQIHKLVWHLEDPYARSESFQLLQIGKVASGFVKSLLCGMEADALFGGMPRHKILWLISKLPPFKKLLGEIYDLTQSGIKPDNPIGKIFEKSYFRNKTAPVLNVPKGMYVPERTIFPEGNKNFVNRFLASAYQNGAAQDGQKLERPFAAWGVRYRTPFIDKNLINTAFSVSEKLKFKNGKNKYILRKALSAWVPKEFISVPKKPQRMDYDQDFTNTLDEVIDLYLSEEKVIKRDYFQFSEISDLRRKKRNEKYDPEVAMRLWTAVLTEIWAQEFIDENIK